MQSLSPNIFEQVASWGISVIGAVAVLLLGLLFEKLVRCSIHNALARTGLDQTLIPFVANLAYYGLGAFVVIAVLSLFGIPTTSFVAVLGAAGLAVGLALQGTLSNFAAGVMLLVFRPFRVGDYVEAAGEEGSVVELGVELGVFASSLETLDRVRVILPNASIWSGVIRNFTASPVRGNDIAVGISYGDNIENAKSSILETLRHDPRVLNDPAPRSWWSVWGTPRSI